MSISYLNFQQQGSLITDESEPNDFWKTKVEPSIEPATLTELKEFAHIDTSDEDTTLTNFIKTARQKTEQYLNRALIARVIVLTMDAWIKRVTELPMPPLINISEVRTLDEDDDETVYSEDNYFVRTNIEPGQLVIRKGITVPLNTDRYSGGFEIEFTAGYGFLATDIPEPIRQGILAWATYLYENRYPGKDIPPEAEIWLSSYRIVNI